MGLITEEEFLNRKEIRVKMSKVDKNWEDFTDWEKKKAFEELSSLIRIRQQKERVNGTPIKKRIEDIKRKFIRGRI